MSVGVLALACARAPAHQYDLAVPAATEWLDCGAMLEAGKPGDWDRLLWGGFAATALRRGDGYLLYYQGSAGYHETEHTVIKRAIGVAVSRDGLRFTKHPVNPVITFSPRGNHEEGAVSSAAFVEDLDRVVMYYGANTWAGGEEVTADARLAVAEDGVHFTDLGVVLDRTDASVWGSGDELFPILSFRHDERRLIYYLPNGTAQSGRLGVAWTDGGGPLRTVAVRSGRSSVTAWGPGSAAAIGPGVYALFLAYSRGPVSYMDVRTVAAERPDALSPPVHRYQWETRVPMAVLLDRRRSRWLLYYRDAAHERYGAMVAPVRGAASPATAQQVLCGSAHTDDEAVDLDKSTAGTRNSNGTPRGDPR